MSRHDMQEFGQGFIFQAWQFDPEQGELVMMYTDAEYGDFRESYAFPKVSMRRYENLKGSIDAAINCLFWVAGVSYYKTSLARQIIFKDQQPNVRQAKWLTDTWQAGLAELAYENNLGWLDHIQFNGTSDTENNPSELKLKPRSLVAIGGGKDSLVSIEAIKSMGEAAQVFMVGQNKFIQSVAGETGLKLLSVSRQVDTKLKTVNQQGAYNGHIPITAINGCVATVAALLYDYDSVVFSNERSADVGNVKAENGQWVNHQYSKSLAYEQQWQNIITETICTNLSCFSLLRPFSELAIIKHFAGLKQYHPHFSSCNRNFHLGGSHNTTHHWCGACPKCAFVFLCLAPFISQAELLAIFHKNLFADDQLTELFEALLGIEGDKPFECVGEQVECRLAVALLADHPEWQDHNRIRHWQAVLPVMQPREAAAILQASEQHLIPSRRNFRQVLNS